MKDNTICVIEGCDRIRDVKQNRRICQMHRVRFGRHKSYDLPTAPVLPKGILKICKKHGALTALGVYKRTPNKDWLSCRLCAKERNDRFNEDHPSSVRNAYKKNYYLTKTGLKVSKELYEELMEKQKGLCAICKRPEIISNNVKSNKPKRLAIDHCHTTNRIRGLLCHKCNITLGAMEDNIDRLKAAINYLQTK